MSPLVVESIQREFQVRELKHFVGGNHVESLSGQVAEIVDPVIGRTYCTAPIAGPEDVDRALRTAATAFETWRETTPGAASTRPAQDRRRS